MASTRDIVEVVPRVLATDPRVNVPTKRTVVAPTSLMGIGVKEMTPKVVLPIVPAIAEEGEV